MITSNNSRTCCENNMKLSFKFYLLIIIEAALQYLTNAAYNEAKIEHPKSVHKRFVSHVSDDDPSNAVNNSIDGHDLIAIVFQMLWNTENWNVKCDAGAKI